MGCRFIIIAFLLCCGASVATAKEQTATLQVPDGGKVIIRYDETVDREGNATIAVLNVQKKLGAEHSNQLDRIRVLFFDKSGGYSNDHFKADIATESLLVPSDEMSYSRSADGVVWLDERPELKLQLRKSDVELSIPVYIAKYEKKHRYRILASCGTLSIPLAMPSQASTGAKTPEGRGSRTITTTEEIEDVADLPDSEVAEILIGRINDLIAGSPADRLPEGLDFYVGQLREVEFNLRDAALKAKIAETLRKVETRKNEVAEYASQLRMQESNDAMARSQQKEARRNLDYLNERLDNVSALSEGDVAEMKALANEMRRQSHAVDDPALAAEMKSVADRCDAEVKKIDDKKKKRNIWMIVGGVLLGILMFVGNQTFQHFRNLRNQKNITEMQDKLAKQAQGEAKRRARAMAYNQMAKQRNAVRGNVTRKVEKGIDNVTKGKGKNITI